MAETKDIWDKARVVGIWLIAIVFAVFLFMGYVADNNLRNDAKFAIAKGEEAAAKLTKDVRKNETENKTEHKKTREMLFKAYQQHEKRLDAIEKAIKKE